MVWQTIDAPAERPAGVPEVIDLVRGNDRVRARGGGSKTALWGLSHRVAALDLSAISGITEYQPGEFTFTAWAGTPVIEINQELAAHGQYLPFDPLWPRAGATLGGTVAANSAGPGRYHYGGVRDFLVGVRFVDGEGRLVRGGGKVVKNAAGFDLPKLMVGSLGELGVLVELNFKVFPRPQATVTVCSLQPDVNQALEALQRAVASRLDVDCLDLEWGADGWKVWARLGGLQKALSPRLDRLCATIGDCRILDEDEEKNVWEQAVEASWRPEGWWLVKIPLTPGRIPALETALVDVDARRRYMSGGQVAWIAVEDLTPLDLILKQLDLSGLVLLGDAAGPGPKVWLGARPEDPFYRRVKQALDPADRFGEV